MGKGKNNESKGAKSQKAQEAEKFDEMLKQLTKVTAEVGAVRKKEEPKHFTKEERQRLHLQQKEAAEKGKREEMQRSLDQQRQHHYLRNMIQNLMKSQQSPFLPEPNTKFSHHSVTSDGFECSVGDMQGWRNTMEDSSFLNPEFDTGAVGLFGVFDGHAGVKTSQTCSKIMPLLAKKIYKCGVIDFPAMFNEMDEALRAKLSDESGSTAVVSLVTPTQIIVANVGDSRAVLCRNGTALALSHDHKPELEGESARILAGGGTVQDNRVNGALAMSRAMGDFQYKKDASRSADKQLVISVPEIISVDRDNKDSFLLMACDGIFDVLSNEEAIDFVHRELQTTSELTEVCHRLCKHCLAPAGESRQPARAAGTDNMTVAIIRFRDAKKNQ